jgi:hypothetical protein
VLVTATTFVFLGLLDEQQTIPMTTYNPCFLLTCDSGHERCFLIKKLRGNEVLRYVSMMSISFIGSF